MPVRAPKKHNRHTHTRTQTKSDARHLTTTPTSPATTITTTTTKTLTTTITNNTHTLKRTHHHVEHVLVVAEQLLSLFLDAWGRMDVVEGLGVHATVLILLPCLHADTPNEDDHHADGDGASQAGDEDDVQHHPPTVRAEVAVDAASAVGHRVVVGRRAVCLLYTSPSPRDRG